MATLFNDNFKFIKEDFSKRFIRLDDALRAITPENATSFPDDQLVILLTARKKLKSVPIIDAVPVVRCKDCKHAGINENHPNKPLICYLTRMCGTVKHDWYCWQGERKDNG